MYKYFKRAIDFVFALIGIILLSPILLITSILIKIDDPSGPILFKQERPGLNGKVFEVYKFRTMKVETHENGKKLSDKERLTKIGIILRKTSIDELPQFFNILKGDMSFIGPRPLLVEYLPYYTEEERKRHSVLPGISGWAQVNGRNNLKWEDRFKKDVYYVDNISFKLDFKILIMTIVEIFYKDNVAVDTKEVEGNLADLRRDK